MTRIAELIREQNVLYVDPSSTVRDAAIRMSEKNVGAVVVLDSQKLVGMFTERDLMTRVVACDLDPTGTPVADVMTREVTTASPEEDTAECADRMRSLNCRHLPVVDDDRLIGMISFRDVLQFDQQRARAHAELLTDLMSNKPEYES